MGCLDLTWVNQPAHYLSDWGYAELTNNQSGLVFDVTTKVAHWMSGVSPTHGLMVLDTTWTWDDPWPLYGSNSSNLAFFVTTGPQKPRLYIEYWQ